MPPEVNFDDWDDRLRFEGRYNLVGRIATEGDEILHQLVPLNLDTEAQIVPIRQEADGLVGYLALSQN